MALRKFCFCCFFLTKYISMPSTTKQKRDTLKNCSVFWEKKPLTQIFTFLTIILLLTLN